MLTCQNILVSNNVRLRPVTTSYIFDNFQVELIINGLDLEVIIWICLNAIWAHSIVLAMMLHVLEMLSHNGHSATREGGGGGKTELLKMLLW